MPIVLVRGNLASYSHKYPWRVLVSGLIADDIKQLNRFPSGGYSDESTIAYLQHPCVVLTALEVLGYTVIASSSTAVKQDYNEYMWTLRRDFVVEPVVAVAALAASHSTASSDAAGDHHQLTSPPTVAGLAIGSVANAAD